MLRGKVAVVVGASGCIGSAIVRKLDDNDATVIGVSKHIPNDRQMVVRDEYNILEEIDLNMRCDITNVIDVQMVFGGIYRRHGRIDILVNTAGVSSRGIGTHISMPMWDMVMDTNVKGVFLCIQAVAERMVRDRGGKIVNISSIAGRSCSSMSGVDYTCSKYAVIGMTRHLARDYAQHHLNINCVCPSQTDSDMLRNTPGFDERKLVSGIPAGRLAKPEDVANVVYFLCTDESSYLNGAIIDVNGGQL